MITATKDIFKPYQTPKCIFLICAMLPWCWFMIIFRPVWISVSVIMRWCVPIFYLLCVLIARTSITIFRVNIWFFLFIILRLRLILKYWFLSLSQDFLYLLWVIGLLIMDSNKFLEKVGLLIIIPHGFCFSEDVYHCEGGMGLNFHD